MDRQETDGLSGRWHESLAAVLVVALLAVILTSPCWATVLIVWLVT